MNTDNKSIILAESSRLIGQIGNNIVLSLHARIREIEALTRTLGATVERLPKSVETLKQLIPVLLDFQGDLGVAGGGVWPEPYAFASDQERRSFFWGRNSQGNLEYFDDYNQSGLGYHHEPWYIVGRYIKSGHCFWSASYMDRYSYQPMITCTAPTFDQGKFSGVVTIDLKLEGLQTSIENWRKKTGGYVFILDRNNKFITFPDPDAVKRIAADSKGNRTEEFILAAEFVDKQPLFYPLAIALDEMNGSILERAQVMPSYTFEIEKISKDSEQINCEEAKLIAAIMTDPLAGYESKTYLYKKFEIDNDFLLKEASTVFLFHVPYCYWKLVVVKPFSEAAIATYSIIQAEKMSSLGQLVAGVAHEVNNPINFIYGNLNYVNSYAQNLLELIKLYQQHHPASVPEIEQYIEAHDLGFLIADLPKILASMKVGADRIRQIVLSLRNFSRMDEAEIKAVDIHEGIESSILLLDSRLKTSPNFPNIQVIKQYSDLPLVECYPGPLNQVFMNILINALDALEEETEERSPNSTTGQHWQPTLRIQTEIADHNSVVIRVADNGPGISEAMQQRLFDPFFTTKPIGKGTGLGLSICYQIITERHSGRLRCVSTLGQGTEFWIEIPIRQRQNPGKMEQ